MADVKSTRTVPKPYFGADIVGLQSPPIRHAYMAATVEHLVRSAGRSELRILEVGSWAGASAITWAKAVRMHCGGRGSVLCVDIWKPYIDASANPEQKFQLMSHAAQDGVIFKTFLENLQAAGIDDLVEYRIGSSREVLPALPAESFDVVYVDASHIYEDVAFDLAQAQRLVARGGIVCGDDLELQLSQVDAQGNAEAVSLGRDTLCDARTGLHYHPGVTRAVSEAFGEVGDWEGYWAIQHDASGWRMPDLSAYSLVIPEHLNDLPRLSESYRGFNLFVRGGRWCAIRQALGPVDVAAGEGELSATYSVNDVFFCDTRDGARTRIEALEMHRALEGLGGRVARLEHGPGDPTVPELVAEYRGYNIVRVGKRFYAINQALGPVNVSVDGADALLQRYAPADLFVCEGTGEAIARIEVIAQAAALQAVQRDLDEARRVLKELQARSDDLRAVERKIARIESSAIVRAMQKLGVI